MYLVDNRTSYRHDIESKEDIKNLVDSFYDRVRDDQILAPIFESAIGNDWDKHLPVMVTFWTTLLVDRKAYTGQPYPKHAVLPLRNEHFDRWLLHFAATIDNEFQGDTADEAKRLAFQIAIAFRHKMGLAG